MSKHTKMDAEAYRARVNFILKASLSKKDIDKMINENAEKAQCECMIKCHRAAIASIKEYMIGKGFRFLREIVFIDGMAEIFFQ